MSARHNSAGGSFAAAALLSLASCSPKPNLLPVNDLDRPTDIAFLCFGAFPDGNVTGSAMENVVTGRPMRVCHPPNVYDPPASLSSRTFAFIANSASGGLTVLDADNWKLVDLDPATAGYGQLPLGANPAQISVSDDGCRLISANRDSCDLTLVDPSVLVAPIMSIENATVSDTVKVPASQQAAITLRPTRADGSPLVAAPYEAVFLPQDTAVPGYDIGESLCQTGATAAAQASPPGWTPAGPAPWHALVTYPACDLIALVALPTGAIEDSVYVRRSGNSVTLVPAGQSPVCPASDCAGQALTPDAGRISDAGPTADAGASPLDAARGADAAGTAPDAAADAGAGTPSDAAADAGLGGAPAGQADASAGDAGAASGGPVPGLQLADVPYFGPGALSPGPIAIKPSSLGNLRAYVGLANASFAVAIDLVSPGTLAAPSTGAAIYLHEGAKGVSRLRLSVDPYKYPQGIDPSNGRWNSTTTPLVSGAFVGSDNDSNASQDETGVSLIDRKYLYAIARDGTLRVVNVSRAPETECETNIDPQNLPQTAGAPAVDPTTACIPVDPAHRRPFSVGPGIHFPTLPMDIAAANIVAPPSSGTTAGVSEDHSEESVQGAYAWVVTASGVVYLVNIDPVLRTFSAVVKTDPNNADSPYQYSTTVGEQWPFINTIRDRNEISYYSGLDPSSGPPRIDVLTTVPETGPYVEQFWTVGSDNNATALTADYVETAVFFPREPPLPPGMPANLQDPIDRRVVTPQTWAVTWEGPLTGTRPSGHVLGEGGTVPGGPTPTPHDAVFEDTGASFCASGVVPGDIVTLTGCTNNAQCGVGEACLLNAGLTSGANGLPITGLCVDPTTANSANGAGTTCLGFLSSLRRYQVVSASPTELLVRPHVDELVMPSLAPCEAETSKVMDSCPDTLNDPTTAKFTCQPDPDGSATPRCLMSCAVDTDCRVGMTCVDFTQQGSCADRHCLCAEAPPLDATAKKCFDQLTGYQLSVGGGFLVEGSASGILTTAAPQASGACAPNPTPDPRFGFRIPMRAPHCGPLGGNAIDNPYDSRIDPDLVSASDPSPDPGTDAHTAWKAYDANLVTIAESAPNPNPCLYFGGPVAGDPLTPNVLPALPRVDPNDAASAVTTSVPGGPPAGIHVRALFRNAQLGFVLANLDRPPVGQFQGSFDVHGGFSPQVVQDPTTVEVSMPARIVLGPVDSQSQTTGQPFTPILPAPAHEVPYLFVVDQRRLGREEGGGPTRGQLLRIHPLDSTVTVGSATGTQPIFQDYTLSGGVFPIQ